jgi:hypothetical protein
MTMRRDRKAASLRHERHRSKLAPVPQRRHSAGTRFVNVNVSVGRHGDGAFTPELSKLPKGADVAEPFPNGIAEDDVAIAAVGLKPVDAIGTTIDISDQCIGQTGPACGTKSAFTRHGQSAFTTVGRYRLARLRRKWQLRKQRDDRRYGK